MKKIKSIFSLLLSFVLVMTMGITAFAEGETYTITINNSAEGHTYEAYQIFTGDLSTNKDNKKVLSNIVWGNGITDAGKTALGDAATKAESLKTAADAEAFAKEIAKYLTNPNTSGAQANDKYTISGLAAGYYLVKDKDNTLNKADDFYTAYIMKIVDNATATPKGDKPGLDKEIMHNESNTWEVVGDNQIGDTVNFRTITTVPDTKGYTKYTYIIHDTMSSGLTSNVKSASDINIMVNDETKLSTDYYSVSVNGNSFDITIDILKAIEDNKMKSGDELYSYYSGVLNESAKIYDVGKEDNTAYLEFSNNPNDNGTGKTKEDKVYDWTFKMGVNKVDEKDNALSGAKFVLSKNGDLEVADMNVNDAGIPSVTEDLIKLIKNADGSYTVAPAGYTGQTTYVIEAGNAVIKGLDDSITYYLYETKAPTGYNLLSNPVSFKINAAYNEDGSALAEGYPTVTVGTAAPSKTLSMNIKNQSGSILPETGGIGTTIFYVVGTLLVVGAGVLLITKKRVSRY